MLKARPFHDKHQRGITMLEVLVTIVILVFGLLGLAGLQAKVQSAELGSYQRVQAVLLLSDMSERINANRSQAPSYVFAGTVGTGDPAADCTVLAIGKDRDICEWSDALKGAAEKKSSSNIGAMLGARGCITLVQAPDPSPAVCAPGIYLVSVAWQGFDKTAAPANACGLDLYGTDSYRRVISTQVTVGLTGCI